MTEIAAIRLAQAHATEWGVPWRQILKTEKERAWWYFAVEWYTFTIDTGRGEAVATIHSQTATVNRFEYYPSEEKGLLLPLWAAFPTYTSVTCGWRQGYGEPYKDRWHSFYRSLSEGERAEYRQKFPPPHDKERCWEGFYELIADMHADGEHPIADFIVGRNP